jgi:tetratricopeptide (TPR) repeat protein
MNPKRTALVKTKNQLFSSLFIAAALIVCSGCSFTFSNWEFNIAERAEKKSDYKKAVKYYTRVTLRDPESDLALISARRASRMALYQVKNFPKAVDLFRYIVNYSPSSEERRKAQRDRY